MSYNFKIRELKENARYTVSTIDKWDGSTKTEEMTGASLKSFTNGCAHLYDIHAEEITEEAPTEETAEQHPNIRKAIVDHEAETLDKFNQEIETKTAADILASWYLKRYTTPKTLEAIENTAPEEKPAADILAKMKAKKAREEAKNTARRLEALALAESCKLPESVNISVEFTRSRTWGSIPHAAITAEQRRTFGTASGCGYDKESAAIASAMNQNPEVMRILYDHAESGEGFPYSVHTFAGLPSFDGGCGVSCFRSVFEACGYEWRQVGNGKTFNAYAITRK